MSNIFEIRDKANKKIRLTVEKQKHIAAEHPDITNIEEIKDTIINPLIVKQSKYDPKSVRWHYSFNKNRKRYILVAAKVFKWGWLYNHCILYEEHKMTQKMFIHYDKEGDFLEVRFGQPTASYYENLGDDLFERRDEKTEQVKGYAIFNIQKRKESKIKDIEVELPMLASS